MIVVVPPIGEDDSGLAQGVDQFTIQAFRSKAAVEALGVSILPGTTGIDVESLDVILLIELPKLGHVIC